MKLPTAACAMLILLLESKYEMKAEQSHRIVSCKIFCSRGCGSNLGSETRVHSQMCPRTCSSLQLQEWL